ncbi:hypothetical protein D7V97_13725 [Corallococcus sp. CA053C]|nr:hypothetical protein D7V97_13725 [Corallococcus sp. CA053C]
MLQTGLLERGGIFMLVVHDIELLRRSRSNIRMDWHSLSLRMGMLRCFSLVATMLRIGHWGCRLKRPCDGQCLLRKRCDLELEVDWLH